MSTKPAAPRPQTTGKWLIVALLCVIATCLVIEASRGTPAAMAQPVAAVDGSAIAVPVQLAADSYGVYLLDTQRGTMAVYQYQASKRSLRLLAVRNYRFDTQLDEYNTEPSPNEIRQLVQQQRRLIDANQME